MPVIDSNLNKRIHIGCANIYAGTTAPDTGTTYPTPVAVSASGIPTNVGAVTYLGTTEGAAKLTYKPSYQEVDIEQAFSTVDIFLQKEEATMTFTCKEATATNISRAIGQGQLNVIAGTPNVNLIQVGGYRVVNKTPIILVSEKRDGSGNFYVVCFYQGFSIEGLDVEFKKDKESVIPITIRAFADLSRRTGDQIFQFIEQTSS